MSCDGFLQAYDLVISTSLDAFHQLRGRDYAV